MIIDKVLGVGESTESLFISGYCDVCVQGLSSGTVALQYKLSPTDELPNPQWTDMPDGTFSADVFKTIFLSNGVRCRLTGSGNNAGVYARLSKSPSNQ